MAFYLFELYDLSMIIDLQLLSSIDSFEGDLLLNHLDQREEVVGFALHIWK